MNPSCVLSFSGPAIFQAGFVAQPILAVLLPSTGSDSAIRNHGKRLAFNHLQREDLRGEVMLQPGQLVRVNLAGLQAEGAMFQAAVTDAVAHIVKQTSEQPPKYLVKLLFSFRGVTEVEVPADRIHADK